MNPKCISLNLKQLNSKMGLDLYRMEVPSYLQYKDTMLIGIVAKVVKAKCAPNHPYKKR